MTSTSSTPDTPPRAALCIQAAVELGPRPTRPGAACCTRGVHKHGQPRTLQGLWAWGQSGARTFLPERTSCSSCQVGMAYLQLGARGKGGETEQGGARAAGQRWHAVWRASQAVSCVFGRTPSSPVTEGMAMLRCACPATQSSHSGRGHAVLCLSRAPLTSSPPLPCAAHSHPAQS